MTVLHGTGDYRSEVEHVTEERFLLALLLVTLVVSTCVTLVIRIRRATRLGRRCGAHGLINQLVELSPVEPNTSTLGTVVNLNALSVSHLQNGVVNWAFHSLSVLEMLVKLSSSAPNGLSPRCDAAQS